MNLDSQPSRRRALSLFAAAVIAAVALPDAARAYDETSTSAVNVDAKGVALKGFDPVSYFKAGGPKQGTAKLTAAFEGATYRFANADNQKLFVADPAKYAPSYGGFCAMGVALGKKLDVDPMAWRVVDGKLYLNVSKDVQKRWLDDVPGNLTQADKTWVQLKDRAPKSL